MPSIDSKAPANVESRADPLIGARLWSGSFGGPGRGAKGHNVAVDRSRNAIVIGEFYDTLNFGGQCGSLLSAGDTDVFVAKFSPDGICQWANAYGNPDTQWGAGVAVDADGNIYVVGSFGGSIDFRCPPPVLQTTGPFDFDIFLAKLNPDGSCVWQQRFGDSAGQFGYAVAVDNNGPNTTVVITGGFEGSVNFGDRWLASQGGSDIYVAKFSSSGVYQQAKSYGDAADQVGLSVAADTSHNVVLTGYFDGWVNFGELPTEALHSAGGPDIFVAKLNPDLSRRWSNRYGDDQPQFGTSLAIDSGGNVLLTGYYFGAVDFGQGIPALPPFGGTDIFLAKIDSGGTPLWAQGFGDPNDQSGISVAIGPADSVFLTGEFSGITDFGGIDPPLRTDGSTNAFLAKFASDIRRNFGSNAYGDRRGAYGKSVSVDLDGRVWLAGYYSGTIDFGGQLHTAQGNTDLFLAKLDHACDGANCAGCCNNNVCRSPSVDFCGDNGRACFACDAFKADRCVDGQCKCGTTAPCGTGQQCVGGQCVCNPASCPNGCCRGASCITPISISDCGGPGLACVTCPPGRADICAAGQCKCGIHPQCSDGQVCQGGECRCNSSSCPGGCCDSQQQCHRGELAACGFGGGSCTVCPPQRADRCTGGSCACGAGGMCVDGQRCIGGTCRCDGTSCPNGCCDGNNQCQHGDQLTQCGTGGAACQQCQGSGVACIDHACRCQGCGTPGSCHTCTCGDVGPDQCGTYYPFTCHQCTCQDLGWCEGTYPPDCWGHPGPESPCP